MTGQDMAIASFIVKYMLSHQKLDLEILKAEFKKDDKAIREAILRLYLQGKVFGRIKIERNKPFLFFNIGNSSLAIEDVMDYNINEFDIKSLLLESQGVKTGKLELEKDATQRSMEESQESAIEISRTKEIAHKEQVTIEKRFGIAGPKLTVQLKIINEGQATMCDCKLKLGFSARLDYLHCWPDILVEKEGDKIVFPLGDIIEQSKFDMIIYFRQLGSGEVSYDGILHYKTPEGFTRLMRLETMSYNTQLPTFSGASLELEMIQPFMKNATHAKKLVAFGRLPKIEPKLVQDHLEQLVTALGFNILSRVNKDNLYLTFCFASATSPKGEIVNVLLAPQIKEYYYGIYACGNNIIVISNLLRILSLQFQQLLKTEKLIKSENELVYLNCIKCGAVLQIFPSKGEAVTCKNCYTFQRPW